MDSDQNCDLQCAQTTNSDEELMRDVADNFISYCFSDLKKFPDVVQSTN